MTDPITGRLGTLVLTGWIGETPDGTDAAYLLLTAPDPRAPVTMPLVAARLGLNPETGSVTLQPDGDARIIVSVESGRLWATLIADGQKFTRPVGDEWGDLATSQRRVVLIVGYAPRSDEHPFTYVEQRDVVLGIIPAEAA